MHLSPLIYLVFLFVCFVQNVSVAVPQQLIDLIGGQTIL